jgi:arylsulfatase A-like enzyme
VFDESGYRTGFIGKMHLGGAFWNLAGTEYTRNPSEIDFTRNFDRGPRQFGFDYSFVLPAGLSGPPYAYFENDRLVRFDPAAGEYKTFGSNDEAVSHFLDIKSSWGKSYGSGLIGGLIGSVGWAMDNYDSRNVGRILTRKALQFLNEAIDENTSVEFPQPFFLYFAPPQLHHPYSPPKYFNVDFEDDSAQAKEGEVVAGAGDAIRLDLIREIDLMVGAIVESLKQHGELENTLIIFSSDNGPITWENKNPKVYPQGTDGGIPLRGAKGEIYEGGHRVPLLARWGNGAKGQSVITPGMNSSQLIGLHDLAATFYAMLGMQRPPDQASDSKSFLPVLVSDQSDAVPLRDHLIIQGSPKSAAENKLFIDRAFYKRDAKGDLWKLSVVSSSIDPAAEITWKELYNLSVDPGETANLFDSAENREWLETMQSEYLQLIIQPQTVTSFM